MQAELTIVTQIPNITCTESSDLQNPSFAASPSDNKGEFENLFNALLNNNSEETPSPTSDPESINSEPINMGAAESTQVTEHSDTIENNSVAPLNHLAESFKNPEAKNIISSPSPIKLAKNLEASCSTEAIQTIQISESIETVPVATFEEAESPARENDVTIEGSNEALETKTPEEQTITYQPVNHTGQNIQNIAYTAVKNASTPNKPIINPQKQNSYSLAISKDLETHLHPEHAANKAVASTSLEQEFQIVEREVLQPSSEEAGEQNPVAFANKSINGKNQIELISSFQSHTFKQNQLENNVSQQIGFKAIKSIENKKDITFHLEPANLGKIELQFVDNGTENDLTTLKIFTEKFSTFDSISKSITQIENILRDSGVKGEISIEMGIKDFNSSKDDNKQQSKNTNILDVNHTVNHQQDETTGEFSMPNYHGELSIYI